MTRGIKLQSFAITITGDGEIWLRINAQDKAMDAINATHFAQALKDAIDPIIEKWRAAPTKNGDEK